MENNAPVKYIISTNQISADREIGTAFIRVQNAMFQIAFPHEAPIQSGATRTVKLVDSIINQAGLAEKITQQFTDAGITDYEQDSRLVYIKKLGMGERIGKSTSRQFLVSALFLEVVKLDNPAITINLETYPVYNPDEINENATSQTIARQTLLNQIGSINDLSRPEITSLRNLLNLTEEFDRTAYEAIRTSPNSSHMLLSSFHTIKFSELPDFDELLARQNTPQPETSRFGRYEPHGGITSSARGVYSRGF